MMENDEFLGVSDPYGGILRGTVKSPKNGGREMNYNELSNRAYEVLSNRAHEVAVARGFWKENTEIEERIMCIVMEVGRAVDAFRCDRRAFKKNFEDNLCHTGLGMSYKMNYNMCIQNTVESAFANIVIRLLDLAGAMQIDFEKKSNEVVLMNYATLKGIDFRAMSFLETAYIFVTQYLTGHDNLNSEWGNAWLFKTCLRYIEQWAAYLGIDLEWFVKTRMELNEGMIYKNGKKF